MTVDPQHVPSWVVAAVDQRLALMAANVTPGQVEAAGLVMSTLTEPPEGASQEEIDRWDQSCDNCGRFCPDTLLVGSASRRLYGVEVVFTVGACPDCASAP